MHRYKRAWLVTHAVMHAVCDVSHVTRLLKLLSFWSRYTQHPARSTRPVAYDRIRGPWGRQWALASLDLESRSDNRTPPSARQLDAARGCRWDLRNRFFVFWFFFFSARFSLTGIVDPLPLSLVLHPCGSVVRFCVLLLASIFLGFFLWFRARRLKSGLIFFRKRLRLGHGCLSSGSSYNRSHWMLKSL